MCLQFRKRGRSRISFVGRQPGLRDVDPEVEDAEDTDGHDADTCIVADVVASVDDANAEVEYTDAEEGGVDDVLQDEYGEGDGGEGEQVFIFSNSLFNQLLNTICFVLTRVKSLKSPIDVTNFREFKSSRQRSVAGKRL